MGEKILGSVTPPSRKAFVTGASTGIGFAIALALARGGYDLAVADLQTEWFGPLLEHVDVRGRTIVPVALDLRVEASIEAAFARARDALGGIDVLVNNAGRALLKPVVDVSWADWDDVIDTNLKGPYFLSQRFGTYCIAEKRPGCVVNIASTHGLTGIESRSVYGISKAGLIQMTRMLAIEWAGQKIRVNAVAPATVMTPSRAAMLSDEAAKARMLRRIPTGAFITPEEVAVAVCYLASPTASSITGTTLMVDGGLTAT
jgi:NAD(P)-dependent dehydrogenase (short-subunit alcohol dehydrogenase family)